jgi:hypothetical protein
MQTSLAKQNFYPRLAVHELVQLVFLSSIGSRPKNCPAAGSLHTAAGRNQNMCQAGYTTAGSKSRAAEISCKLLYSLYLMTPHCLNYFAIYFKTVQIKTQ